METINDIIARIVIYGGGGIAISYAVFRHLGEKWIDSRFAEKLKKLEHDQNVVVARLKVEIESMLNGALKFQEREFDVLPAVWEKLYQACVHMQWFTAKASPGVPDALMDEDTFPEWLDGSDFSEAHKIELRRAQPEDRMELFIDLEYRYKATNVRKIFGEYQQYLEGNAIFFPPNLKAKLDEIETALWAQFNDRDSRPQMKAWGLEQDPNTTFEKVIPPLRDEIEVLIRQRLESHMRAAAK